MLKHMSVQNITIRLISGPTSTAKTPSDQRVLPPGKASPTDEAFMPARVLLGPKPFEIQDQLLCDPEHPGTDFNPVDRIDGLIVLAMGENVRTQTLETSLVKSGLVKSAIVFGCRQFEIEVIVEAIAPFNSLENWNIVREAVWPVVVQAGNKMDDHAKVSSSDAINVVPSGTVIPRTGKGSVARRETLEARPIGYSVKPLDTENLEQGLIDLTELTFSEQKPSIAYLLKSPVRQSWSDILITLGSQLYICQFLSFEVWMNLVVRSDPKCVPGQNPALQLEEFFREDVGRIACGSVIMATNEAIKQLGILRLLDAVLDDIVASYVQHWHTSGYFL
ncbi:NRPS-like enzyme [Penicillium frequentans]|nr:NRPS-like enzyme [Penicillium glabrum]